MVADAHAVVEPLAVMIEAVDAPIANIAVSRLLGSQDLARGTQITLLEVLVELKETNFTGFPDNTRVFSCSHKECR